MTQTPSPIDLAATTGTTIDRYTLVRKLGGGSQGEVYEATDREGQRVAIKLMAPGTETTERRFLREASIASKIRGHRVVPVIDHGVDRATGRRYLVMPLLHGESLDKVFDRVAPIDPKIAIEVAVQICLALENPHAMGVVHRDIKPANIFAEQMTDNGFRVRVFDFGMAKSDGELRSLTVTGSAIGTPLYMAPEQALNSKLTDARADVWAIGVVLYHALTGQTPLASATSYKEWLTRLTQEDPTPIQELAPWIRADLALVVHGALIRDREKRCPTVNDLCDALQVLNPNADGEKLVVFSALSEVDKQRGSQRIALPKSWEQARPTPLSQTHASSSRDTMLGRKISGKYHIERPLGEGGMGAIYAARDPANNQVAIKIVKPELMGRSSEVLRRFLREARAAMAVQNTHVVRTIEAGTDTEQGVPFLVMDLLNGTDLGRLVEDEGPLAPDIAVRIAIEACEGIHAAHSLGLIHRDIKPANIFLHQGENGEVVTKICDFGVAKENEAISSASAGGLTQTGGLVGSPMYMSPEQAHNAKTVDIRSDIWSLVISLQESLTGVRPWSECTSMGELMMALYSREPTPIQDIAPWIEPNLADVIARGLERDPANRWQSAKELAEALKPWAYKGAFTWDKIRGGVPSESRLVVAPRSSASLSKRAQSAAKLSAGASGAVPARSEEIPPQKSSKLGVAVVGTVVTAALLVGGLSLNRTGNQHPKGLTHSAVQTSAASIAPSASAIKAKLEVSPAGVLVKVDGQIVPVLNQIVEIEKPVGQTAQVVLEYQGEKLEAKVAVTADGTTLPAKLDIVAKGATAPSGSAATTTGAGHKNAPKDQPKQGTKDPPTPPTTPTTEKPGFKTTW